LQLYCNYNSICASYEIMLLSFMDLRKLKAKFNIRSEQEDYDVIHDTVEKGIFFKGTNLWILIFAILIACVGLNVNSTAVIIGAMLISPLMGPILGMGYSLATYDFTLFRKSLVNFGFAVASGLVASTVYFSVTPLGEAHSELLARTQPNIYDVIIALAGGLAGIIALSSKQKGNVIPGVAIATALMPPLCTAGYGLATGTWNYFFGAFYLFTINTVFIAVATLLIVRFLKYPIWHGVDENMKRAANRWVSIIATITVLPSIYFGYILVQQERFSRNALSYIRNETHIPGDYLLKSEVDPAKRSIRLIYGGRLIPDNVKQEVIAKAKHYDLAHSKITIQQGFSLEDEATTENLLAINSQQTEIDRLRAELSHTLHMQDSTAQRKHLGRQLLQELKPLYPEITACGAADQVIYDDSLKAHRYFALFVASTDRRKTLADQEKLAGWFRSRLNADSVKVYVE
jgi:Predicted membrane protein